MAGQTGAKILPIYILFLCCFLTSTFASKPPNIILLYADDLGYGDLPSYGHPVTKAPVLDYMAANGLRFLDFYAASPVCTPARASILTGRHSLRTGVWPGVFYSGDYGGLPLEEITIAEVLKTRGYSTAHIGKWHLGVGENYKYMPPNQGFDYYFGIPYTHDDCPCLKCFYPDRPCTYTCNKDTVACPLFRNLEIIEQPTDFTTLSAKYSNEARQWISEQAQTNKPFFLYYGFHQPHNPMFSGEQFTNATKRGLFGDNVLEMDWMVGQVLEEVRQQGLQQDTFIFFTSDNGPCMMRPFDGIGSPGLLKCGKGTTYEGGQRVPAIAYWPGRIQPGVTDELASALDLLPTFANLAGASLPGGDVVLDGFDMANILFNHGKSLTDRFLFYPAFARPDIGAYAVRYKNYKAHYLTSGNPNSGDEWNPDVDCRRSSNQTSFKPALVFDLAVDPQEMYVLNRSEHYDVYAKLYQIKVQTEANMSWRPSEIDKPFNISLAPCCNPGCDPVPQCCVCPHQLITINTTPMMTTRMATTSGINYAMTRG